MAQRKDSCREIGRDGEAMRSREACRGHGRRERRRKRPAQGAMFVTMTGGAPAVVITIGGNRPVRGADRPGAGAIQPGFQARAGLKARRQDGRERKNIGERDHRDRAQIAPLFGPRLRHHVLAKASPCLRQRARCRYSAANLFFGRRRSISATLAQRAPRRSGFFPIPSARPARLRP